VTEGNRRWPLAAATALVPCVLVGLLVTWAASRPVEPLPDAVGGGTAATSSGAPTPAAPTFAPPALPTGTPCTRSAPLRVMTFNIHHGAKGSQLNLEQVEAEIRAVNPDVVALQEVDRNNARSAYLDEAAWLGERLKLTPVFEDNRPLPGDRGPSGYGNAILTRLPVVGTANLRMPNQRGLEPRGLLLAALDLHGIPLVVGATHFQHRPAEPRVLQAEYVVKAFEAQRSPRVLMGDLNDEPGTRPLAILGGLLHDVWPEVGRGNGWTHPAFHADRRIDFVLGDAAVRAAQAGTLVSHVSDHRAVWADLSVTGPVDCPGRAALKKR